jgi:hypothetical protein
VGSLTIGSPCCCPCFGITSSMIRSDVPLDAEVKRPPGGRSSLYWRKTLDKRWGVLSLQPHVSERSSPSWVRSGESFQTRKRFSSAAHNPRALDRCGRSENLPMRRERGQMQRSKHAQLPAPACLPMVGSRGSCAARLRSNQLIHLVRGVRLAGWLTLLVWEPEPFGVD